MGCTALTIATLAAKRCKTKGGIGTEFYLFDIDNIASYTRDATTKIIQTFVLLASTYLQKVEGFTASNEAKTDVTGGENYPDYVITFLMGLLYKSQLEKDDIENICNAEKIGVIYPTNEGQWKIAGINKDPALASLSQGMKMKTASFPEGKTGQDSTMATVLLEGMNTNGTVEFLISSGTFLTTRTYLEALLAP